MASKAEERREQLAARLIEAASLRMARDGVASLRARDLAKDAGCAVGGIYSVFRDLDELILKVNAITFHELGAFVHDGVRALGDAPAPEDQLIAMGHAYLGFAQENTRRWLALFEIAPPADAPLPEWYLSEVAALFEIIRAPLAQLRPDLTAEATATFVRTLFSAVHGIVLLGVQQRVSAVRPDDLKGSIEMLLRSAVR